MFVSFNNYEKYEAGLQRCRELPNRSDCSPYSVEAAPHALCIVLYALNHLTMTSMDPGSTRAMPSGPMACTLLI